MAAINLQADSADHNAEPVPEGVSILKFRINGVIHAADHRDATDGRIEEAHALLMLLSTAFEDAETVGHPAGDRIPIMHLPPRIIAKGQDGVCALLAYARYHSERIGRA